jgi:hypothetical protein
VGWDGSTERERFTFDSAGYPHFWRGEEEGVCGLWCVVSFEFDGREAGLAFLLECLPYARADERKGVEALDDDCAHAADEIPRSFRFVRDPHPLVCWW